MDHKANMDGRRHYEPSIGLPQARVRLAFTLLPLLILMLALASCMRLRDEGVFLLGYEEARPLDGSATLVCQDDCRDRSQCGTIDTSWVVLAAAGQPTIGAHDLTFADRSQVTIIDKQLKAVQLVRGTGPDQRVWFYEVQAADERTGWVAGWCIGQQVVP